VPTLVPIFSGTSGPALKTSGPALKVEEVEIALAKNIDASDQIPGSTAPKPEKDTGSAIDITLRNTGDAPALIVKAVFSFTRTTELDSCAGGAGAGVSTAQYDVKVLAAKPVTVSHPFTLYRDMRFVINANSIDRFRISVGPDRYSSVSWPWIYEFNLSLVEDDGQRLDLGPMSILGFLQVALRRLRGIHFTASRQLILSSTGGCHASTMLRQKLLAPWPDLAFILRSFRCSTTKPSD
jgi:hypothetical protein